MDRDPLTTRCRRARVLVVHDERLGRAALSAAIDEAHDLVVVGEAATGEHGLLLCAALEPDVVVARLTDAGTPSGPGPGTAELARRIGAAHPAAQVMAVAASVDGDEVRRALEWGVVGYLLEDVSPAALRDGVRAVARGESPLDPRAVRAMLRARPTVRAQDLTVREREVLALVMRGLANKQIARELQITDSTVKAHVGSILARIGVADRTSAAIWAARNLRPETVDAWEDRPLRPSGGAVRSATRTDRWTAAGARRQPVIA